MQLHGTTCVILMVHSDCAAYAGLAGCFGGDADAEAAHHQQALTHAAANQLRAIPGIQVQVTSSTSMASGMPDGNQAFSGGRRRLIL